MPAEKQAAFPVADIGFGQPVRFDSTACGILHARGPPHCFPSLGDDRLINCLRFDRRIGAGFSSERNRAAYALMLNLYRPAPDFNAPPAARVGVSEDTLLPCVRQGAQRLRGLNRGGGRTAWTLLGHTVS